MNPSEYLTAPSIKTKENKNTYALIKVKIVECRLQIWRREPAGACQPSLNLFGFNTVKTSTVWSVCATTRNHESATEGRQAP